MQKVKPDVSFPDIEKDILKFWTERDIFRKSLEIRRNGPRYSFYDGPPFATGTPHYGHLLAGTLKDIVPRYFTMLGYYVERRFGWDCHGLPIEMLIEEQEGLKGPRDVVEFGVERFNEACRASVLKYEKEWRYVTARLGRWVDFDNDYKTMDPEFMESVWWVFKTLWEKGLIYSGKRVMAYSWRLGTTLSNFEAGLNYKEVQDPSVYVKFWCPELNAHLLVWTTTPWTIPANVAIACNPELGYSIFEFDGQRYVALFKLRESLFKNGQVIDTFPGDRLSGLHYEPNFPYVQPTDSTFKVVPASFVSEETGTGLVHIAPCYGEDDFNLSKQFNLPVVDLLDESANFLPNIDEFGGKNFKEADSVILNILKAKDRLFKRETINHSYPFCYRSDTPLIYRAVDGWYVKVEQFRDKLLECNSRVYWVPEYVKDGRFGNWLEQAKDWNISRNRFWGNPIPIWICENCGSKTVVGSRQELCDLSGVFPEDLHTHVVDKITFRCDSCGGTKKRVKEVLDCWFESGAMPYASVHYPFENREVFESSFPADFIAEGMDQTRGWFYTLLVLGALLFDTAPYKNVVVNGIVLAEDGKKMSKRLKNYPDPMDIINTYGADSLRLYMINSPVVRGENLRFSENGVRETVRKVLLPLWNAYSFFVNYALIDGFNRSSEKFSPSNPLDVWILSKLMRTIKSVRNEMQHYRLYRVVPILVSFIDDLTNWYIRRSRRRFWGKDNPDKTDAYETLFRALYSLTKLMAPFVPFVTEAIYSNLRVFFSDAPESVHLCEIPQPDDNLIDDNVEQEMDLVRRIVEAGRSLRNRLNLKIRQPLQTMKIISRRKSVEEIVRKYSPIILEELNVKEVQFDSNEHGYVSVSVRPLTPVLGPRLGDRIKGLFQALKTLTLEDVQHIEDQGFFEFEDLKISISELVIERVALNPTECESFGDFTILFDTNISHDLYLEMIAREFTNRVQKLRKELDLDLTDRIKISYSADSVVSESVNRYSEYIKEETLAVFIENTQSGNLVEVSDIDGYGLRLGIEKI